MKPTLRQLIWLIALSIFVMLSLLGVWIYRGWEQQRIETQQRITAALVTADLQEIFVRLNRRRAVDHMLFYLPSTSRLNELIQSEQATSQLADEMRQTFHFTIDSWLPIEPQLTDSIFRTLLESSHIRPDYRLQLFDAVNGDTLFSILHRQSNPLVFFREPPLTVTDTLWLDDDIHAYILARQDLTPILLAQNAPTLLLFALLLLGAVGLIVLLLRQEDLENASTDFAHNITHELKTPIAVALAAHEALIDFGACENTARRKDLLETSRRQLLRLSSLVEQVLTFHRSRATHVHLHKEHLALPPLLHRLEGDLRLKADRPLTLHLDLDPEVASVFADPTHLYNLLSNLLDNAVRYSPLRADITLRVWRDAHRPRIYFSVADRGMGIARKYRKRIFRKFYRITDGSRQTARGYGLGLFYVRTMVERHGGRISVDSTLGKGSTFTFFLPIPADAPPTPPH